MALHHFGASWLRVSFVWRQASHSSWAPKMCHGRGKTLGKTSSHGEEDLLGVRRGTEKSEIRKLFRKRVQTEHPDVNPDDPDAAERFQELVAAYNSVMGDELLPDELNFVRVQMTARYKKQLEADQSVKNGIFYALLPGITISLIGIAFFAMDSLNISEYLGP
ncbi:unnamed protein product [Cladocopium goreaui]|uniref:Blue-light-activated histidine kinase 1 n=1 Tax=Cladocopium goreaui TaxID=2562237 RepID=A0A9P1FHW6_9DINO|nr:unnamed protein product [Cladocopium goreaui]